MRYLVNSREMRQYDKNTSEVFGMSSLLLMEQAALAACEEIEKSAQKEKTILIVCGTGNNGGDGLAIARILYLRGYSVEVVLLGDKNKATEQNKKQQEILKAYQISVHKAIPSEKEYHVVIDAIFGVGLTRKIEGEYRSAIEKLNTLSGYKIAIDMPSGISTDDGAVLGTAFYADKTITFAFDKVGLHLWPGNVVAGDVVVKEIGITEHSFLDRKPVVAALEEKDLDKLTTRPSHANKGTFGKVLVIAGSVNMAGAAILAGKSAYVTGCGLVRILTPEENRVIIQTALPEAILTTYSAKKIETEVIKNALDWADVVLIGPGIGTGEVAEGILRLVLKSAAVPIVLDADALNLVAKETDILKKPHTEMVVTPHLGEMSRLTCDNVAYLQTRLLATAKDFANTYNVTCVLKDERTIISTPYGVTYLNLSGNSGMATAGSGDVLAGVIASLMAQGHSSEQAAPLAVYLHGASGDCMVKETGKAGLVASDLITGIRRIFGCKER